MQTEQEELVQEGGLLDSVRASLSDSSDPRAPWVLALALRRKGTVHRDMGAVHRDMGVVSRDCDIGSTLLQCLALRRYSESTASLLEAVDLCASCSLDTDELKVERILCLCELSGSLDYMGNMEQGISATEQAVSLARSFYGAKTSNMVTVLCLTTLGDHVKNRDHTNALALYMEALSMRKEVLGLRHTKVAMSLQQCGMSLRGLQRYDEAEEMLNQSLAIRVDALGEYHPLVANSQRQLADLYRACGKNEQSQQCLRRLLSIAPQIGWGPGHKKVQAAARDLADLVRKDEDENEAAALEAKYVNVMSS
ncbi:hypothetical protein FOA52_003367 [Chlamydomonas sp. UWO 241]|nr:hypothetical protein FOA52_003367 [Chlamydomonas sp. UWO 241]